MIVFINSSSSEQAKARQSLDMMMMAISLNQITAAVYTGDAVQQLTTPDGNLDPLKKMKMLTDLFDFEAFYVAENELARSGLSMDDFRVPAKVISDTELSELLGSAKHKIRF